MCKRFAFLSRYYNRCDAENAVRYINRTRLDDRVIRADWDVGFSEGRQFGRGKHGGQVYLRFVAAENAPFRLATLNYGFQVRDEVRQDFDLGRGGWNRALANSVKWIE